MDIDHNVSRRRFQLRTTTVVGAAGLSAAVWPFIASLKPSERARQTGAPVTVDFSKIEPGQQITVEWRQRPVWVLRRMPEMLEQLNAAMHLSHL